MKKIIISILMALCMFSPLFLGNYQTYATCEYSETNSDISGQLANCLNNSKVVNVNQVKLEDEFQAEVQQWTSAIARVVGVLAVGAIVLGGLMMTLSTGEEEKIKKAKDIIKWGILGFLAVILASTIIRLVINIMYTV